MSTSTASTRSADMNTVRLTRDQRDVIHRGGGCPPKFGPDDLTNAVQTPISRRALCARPGEPNTLEAGLDHRSVRVGGSANVFIEVTI